jgi:hypothetical protein
LRLTLAWQSLGQDAGVTTIYELLDELRAPALSEADKGDEDRGSSAAARHHQVGRRG